MKKKNKVKKHALKRRNEILSTLGVSSIIIVVAIVAAMLILPKNYNKIITDAAEWMLASQEDSGHFRYEYDPWKDTSSSADNIVRQSGASYILAELASEYQDGRYLLAAQKGLEYLSSKSTAYTIGEKNIYAIGPERNLQTGTLALASIACEHLRGTSAWDEKLAPYCDGYTALLTLLELPNGGWSAQYHPGKDFSDPLYAQTSSYSDGEAWLALVVREVLNPDKELEARLDKHFKYFREYYGDQITREQNGEDTGKEVIGFYLWGMRALNLLDEKAPQKDYADFAYLYTDHVIQTKHLEDYTTPGYQQGNNCYVLEGLISTYAIADRHQDTTMRDRLKGIIEKHLARLKGFQLQANSTYETILNERIVHLPLANPEQAIGGFLNSIKKDQQQMRIDYTQHCIGAYLLAEKYLR